MGTIRRIVRKAQLEARDSKCHAAQERQEWNEKLRAQWEKATRATQELQAERQKKHKKDSGLIATRNPEREAARAGIRAAAKEKGGKGKKKAKKKSLRERKL